MSLAIECGATSSSVLYINSEADPPLDIKRFKMGSANFKIMSSVELEGFCCNIRMKLGIHAPVTRVGIGMPGIISVKDKLVVEDMVRKIWPKSTSWWVGSDVETAMACLSIPPKGGLKVIVIGGTGSNCFGSDGKSTIKIGGFGHLLGDRGSSYAIALRALRLALRESEHSVSLEEEKLTHPRPESLLSPIMKRLNLDSIPDLVTWSTNATKVEVAGLAQTVIEQSRGGNALAQGAIAHGMSELAEDCIALIKKFSKSKIVELGLTGSLFTKNDDIADMFTKLVKNGIDSDSVNITFTTLHETVHGALQCLNNNNNDDNNEDFARMLIKMQKSCYDEEQDAPASGAHTEVQLAEKILPVYLGLPQTECRNPNSMNLDTMSIGEAVDLMISEESKIYDAIAKQKPQIEILIEKVSSALKVGGRLFYVGAGTSGRLGILDATECPPTFRTQPEMVQGIIAGGFSSVSKAKEGAEDSIIDGMDAIRERFVSNNDVVVGIAASGRTPFVWGAMYQAQLLGAFATFLTFNVKLDMKIKPDLVIAMDLGPEILTGSTRLKSGSATKCVLNMLSTLAMVRMGKCFENLMVDLNPANQKLKQRALRIVMLMTSNLGSVTEEVARPILIKNKYDIKTTVLELRKLNS